MRLEPGRVLSVDFKPARITSYNVCYTKLLRYTGCFQVCPTTTKHLESMVRQAERALGPGTFRVATIGFNLPFDSPEAMRDFARKQGVRDPNFV